MTTKKNDPMAVAIHNFLFRVDDEWFSLGAFYAARKDGYPEGEKTFTVAFMNHLIKRFEDLIAQGTRVPPGTIDALNQLLLVLRKQRPSEDEKALVIMMLPVLKIPRRY